MTATDPLPRWRDVVWPKEHGSWSLALEPISLGLLAAPSWAGAALALAAATGFFLRRPLRIAFHDAKAGRRTVARRSLLVLGLAALLAGLGSAWIAGSAFWLVWSLPTVAAGAVFLAFDLQKSGRDQAAEVAGSIAFAWLPAVFAVLADWPADAAMALGATMLARALPTVLTVRAFVRARKTGEHHTIVPLTLSVTAAIAAGAASWFGLLPWAVSVLLIVLAARAVALLVVPRPTLRASTLGMTEAVVGVAYVLIAALAWRGAVGGFR